MITRALLALIITVASVMPSHAKPSRPPASPWFLHEVLPLITPIVDLAHTDNYGIDGDVITWEKNGSTWWTFVLVVLRPDRQPVASIVTVKQEAGERMRLWQMSAPFLWTPDISLIAEQH